MGDLVLGAGLFLAVAARPGASPRWSASASPWSLHRRQRGVKLAFNLAEYALGGCAGHDRLRRCSPAAGSAPGTGWRRWSPSWSPPSTADLCIFAVISLSEGRADPAPLLEMLALSAALHRWARPPSAWSLARTAVSDPAALALLALPTLLIVAAYRAYTRRPRAAGEPARCCTR